MVTKMKIIKIITIILAIILITLIAFGGIYIQTQNRMENKVKEYSFGREIKGGRVVEVKVTEGEDSKTKPEDLTIENYEIVKRTIEKRLQNLGAQDYTISLNEENGTIIVELEENANTDTYVYFLTADSKVQIKEKDSENELLTDSMVTKATYTYNVNAEGEYQVYMDLYLNEEGQAKIEEIKNNYAIFADEIERIEAEQESEEENKEAEDTKQEGETEENTENKEESKKIAKLTAAGNEYDIDKIEKDKIIIKIGNETSNTSYINNYMNVATEIALLVNSGKYPIQYEIGNNRFIYSDITNKQIEYFAIAIAVIILIALIGLIIKYKTKGILVSVSYIGFISLLLLVLRYTNVNISIEGIGGIILVLIINFIINQIMLRKTSNIDYKELALKLIPIVIITVVFSFAKWSNLSSFGMVMFWGLLLIGIYNFMITKTLLDLKENK